MLNRLGDSTQPCLTPGLTRNSPVVVLATLTLAFCFLHSLVSKSTICAVHPIPNIVSQSVSLDIESKSFPKSTKRVVVDVNLFLHYYFQVCDPVSGSSIFAESRLFYRHLQFCFIPYPLKYNPKSSLLIRDGPFLARLNVSSIWGLYGP